MMLKLIKVLLFFLILLFTATPCLSHETFQEQRQRHRWEIQEARHENKLWTMRQTTYYKWDTLHLQNYYNSLGPQPRPYYIIQTVEWRPVKWRARRRYGRCRRLFSGILK